MSKIMHMDTQYAGITPERDFSELIDFFYPIGCYFETSDDSFDPNVSWGGAWVLEEEGNVHVSSGDHYLAGEDGGSTTSTVPTTKLSDENIAHGHGFTQPKIPNHKHAFTQPTVPKHTHGFTQPKIPNHKHNSDVSGKSYLYGLWQSGRAGQVGWNAGTGTAYYGYASLVAASDVNASGTTGNPSSLGSCTGGAVSEKAAVTCTGGAVGDPSSLPACTGGAVTNLSGASSTRTAHGHGSVSTMQPYIVVNRWHRIG